MPQSRRYGPSLRERVRSGKLSAGQAEAIAPWARPGTKRKWARAQRQREVGQEQAAWEWRRRRMPLGDYIVKAITDAR